jgi:hypothetical protein
MQSMIELLISMLLHTTLTRKLTVLLLTPEVGATDAVPVGAHCALSAPLLCCTVLEIDMNPKWISDQFTS